MYVINFMLRIFILAFEYKFPISKLGQINLRNYRIYTEIWGMPSTYTDYSSCQKTKQYTKVLETHADYTLHKVCLSVTSTNKYLSNWEFDR